MGAVAWVDEVRMSNEDRQLLRHQASTVFEIYLKKEEMTKEQIHKHYAEWSNIARRLREGGKMLDNKIPIREQTVEYMKDLENHYRFMLNLFGWYDLFFKVMLNDEQQITKARDKILDIFSGVIE